MENQIRALRKEQGISQEDLARRCGVSRQTINAIENNKYDPTLSLAFRLARELGVTVDGLFTPGVKRTRPAAVSFYGRKSGKATFSRKAARNFDLDFWRNCRPKFRGEESFPRRMSSERTGLNFIPPSADGGTPCRRAFLRR